MGWLLVMTHSRSANMHKPGATSSTVESLEGYRMELVSVWAKTLQSRKLPGLRASLARMPK